MTGVLILFLWLLVIPIIVGTIPAKGVDKYRKNLVFRWIGGQMLLWAFFQLLSVPVILFADRLDPLLAVVDKTQFWFLQVMYTALTIVLVIAGIVIEMKSRRQQGAIRLIHDNGSGAGKWNTVLWILFWVLLLFQMVQSVRMTYADGDDAFYVAVSIIAEESGNMYQKLPYTGGSTGLDIRHGLAPFPIWIAFLARVSGIETVSVAHVAVPLALLPMTYGIYYLIGTKLTGRNHGEEKREKLPLFLVFTEILVLFGDYSFYTAENFMIARSRQGKSALGSIVIPMAFFLFLVILEKIQEYQKIQLAWWGLLLAVVMVACLCGTMGAVLLCMLTGVTGLCSAVCYKRWKVLIPMAACCIPAVCYALIYLMSGETLLPG